MSDQEWAAYLDTLPLHLRALAQAIMGRIDTILARDRDRNGTDIQQIARRAQHANERIDRLHETVEDLLKEREHGR